MSAWPKLPAADTLVVDEPAWPHPGIGAGGVAHLRVWATTDGGHLAVVTEQGVGCSTTNAAEHIHSALAEQYGPGVVHLEHYPAAQRVVGPDTLDQVIVTNGGRPQWRRIWPTPTTNSHHEQFDTWVRTGGAAILNTLDGAR